MNLQTGDIKSDCCIKTIEKLKNERKVMQSLMKLQLDYEVLRADILNRGTKPDMDSVLSELLHQEISILTQATLQGKKEVKSIFFTSKHKASRFLQSSA